MDAIEAILKRRAIRLFSGKKIERSLLERITDAGRLAPTSANMQPLKFLIIDDKEKCERIFRALKWAAYLPQWTPPEDKQPTAYIFILLDTEIKRSFFEYDVGLSAQNMMIASTALGLGSCCLLVGTAMKEILNIPERYRFTLVIALGYPVHNSKTTDLGDSIKYSMDENNDFSVPKRKKEDVVFFDQFE
jgi:nitroreductase